MAITARPISRPISQPPSWLPLAAKVAPFLAATDKLTRDGVEYVKEAIAEAQEGLGSKEVVDLWRQHYADAGYDMPAAVEVEL